MLPAFHDDSDLILPFTACHSPQKLHLGCFSEGVLPGLRASSGARPRPWSHLGPSGLSERL